MNTLFRSLVASTALFVAPLFAFAAADPSISSVSASIDNSTLGETSTHTITFTTENILNAGQTISFLYTTNVSPAEIGVDFVDAEFSESEDHLDAEFTVPDSTSYVFMMTLNSELPAATYTVTAANVQNPTEDITAYASITTDDELGESSNFTTETGGGVSFGNGSSPDEEGDGPGTPPSCEEEPEVELLDNASAFVFGEYVYVNWDELDTANSYVVMYSLEENRTNQVTVETGIEDTEYLLTGLDTGTPYYLTVRADDENTCQVGVAEMDVTTDEKTLTEKRMLKSEFKFPKKKRKRVKFNIKPELGEEAVVIQRLEYQIFKGKKAAKAKRIGKKVRKQKNKVLGNAIVVKGKNVEPGTYYWVRMRKVYKIGDDVIKTKYSKKKRVKTKAPAEETM